MKDFKQLLKNEKGFTLVEILVVIAIIAILFVTLLPQIDNAVDRSRETGVKTDFHTYQTAAETYLRETAGQDITADGLNNFLDPGMYFAKLATDGNNTSEALDTVKEDPWGQTYEAYVYQDDEVIVIRSEGQDEQMNTEDDYVFASYYYQGQVLSCTTGFDTNNIKPSIDIDFKCGVTTPANPTTDLVTNNAQQSM